MSDNKDLLWRDIAAAIFTKLNKKRWSIVDAAIFIVVGNLIIAISSTLWSHL